MSRLRAHSWADYPLAPLSYFEDKSAEVGRDSGDNGSQPKQTRNALLPSASGLSIRAMHRCLRIIAAIVVLVAFSSTATDSGRLLSASWKAAAKDPSCPLHRTKCCCPKVCKTPPKAEPSCHKSAQPTEQAGAVTKAPTTECVLKAGCGSTDTFVGFLPLLKDFVPESLEQIECDSSRSVFASPRHRFLLLDSSLRFFHPPRNS